MDYVAQKIGSSTLYGVYLVSKCVSTLYIVSKVPLSVRCQVCWCSGARGACDPAAADANFSVLAGTFEVEGPGADGHWRARDGAQNYCASKQRQNSGSECVGCSDLAVHGPPAFV